MPDLDPEAVKMLWPVVQILGALLALVVSVVGGFRWLRNEIKDTASDLINPVAIAADRAQRTADAANQRMDRFFGKERHETDPDPDSTASRRLRGGA
jgi:hypothetical protein